MEELSFKQIMFDIDTNVEKTVNEKQYSRCRYESTH